MLSDRDDRHSRVVFEASRLYAMLPAEAIGLDTLADSAGVERTWIYRKYGNRDQLYRAVARRWLSSFENSLNVQIDTAGGVLAYLRRQTDALELSFATPEHVNLMRVMMRECRRDDWLTERYERLTDQIAAKIEGRIREAGYLIGVHLAVRAGAAAHYLAEAAMRVTYPLLWPWRIELDNTKSWRDLCIAKLAQSAFAIIPQSRASAIAPTESSYALGSGRQDIKSSMHRAA